MSSETDVTAEPKPAATGVSPPGPTAGIEAEHPAPPGPRRRITSGLMITVAATVVAGVLVARLLFGAFAPHLYAGTILQADTAAPPMADLSFTRNGEPVDVGAQHGNVVLVFFGYTNCPDVCPATMALVRQALAGLDEGDRARTDVWMVTVDPGRDDPASLQSYVEFFDPGFEGITGEVSAIDRVTVNYGVYYDLEPTAAEGADDYLVDHTASLFGIDPGGALRIVWPPTATAEEIRADIEELL